MKIGEKVNFIYHKTEYTTCEHCEHEDAKTHTKEVVGTIVKINKEYNGHAFTEIPYETDNCSGIQMLGGQTIYEVSYKGEIILLTEKAIKVIN